MEAMFDRMDAIGKSVLGLTIQCAQCHNHKFDPLTQEEYYRLFAFLNNAHEAQRRRLHARRADEAGRHLPADPRDRGRPAAPARPTGPSGWPRGRQKSRNDQPEWTVVRPEVDDISTGGQQVPAAGGRLASWPRATRPTKHRVQADGADRPARTSPPSASSCSTTRICRCGGPGRSIRGTGALTEFEVEAAPAERPGQGRQGQVRAGDRRRRTRRRRPLEPIFDDKIGTTARHRARSPSPSTARTRRPGASTPAPAAATSRARPSSSPRRRSRFAGGTDPHLLPAARTTAAGTATTTRTTTSAASASR